MPGAHDAAPKLPAAFAAPPHSGPVECLGLTFESDEARREYFPRTAEGEAPRSAAAARLPRSCRRGHPAAVRSPVLHCMPQPVPGRLRRAPRPAVRPPGAVPPRALRRRRQRRQDRPALPGARLPHQGGASGDRPVDPALHATGRPRSRRLLRLRHDRRRRPVVRRGPARLPPDAPAALAGGGTRTAGVGRPPRGPRRPLAGRHVHRRQLQRPVRRRRVPRRRRPTLSRGRGRGRLDVRDAPHRRADRAHQLHRVERGVLVPRLHGRGRVPRRGPRPGHPPHADRVPPARTAG